MLFPDVKTGVQFFIDAEPIPQPRQRHAVRNGIAVNYLPKDHPIHVFKQVCRIRAKAAYDGKPMTGPLKVVLLFLMPRPARLIWKTRAMPRSWASGKPDIDNLAKAIFDSFNELIWQDDAQIVSLSAMKMYASGNESPGVEVSVEELP